MKSQIILKIIVFLSSLKIFATAQIPDLLIYKGETLSLFTNPLESFYNKENPRPYSFGMTKCINTACWRGYVATWEIKNDRLYLLEIKDCCYWGFYKITDEVVSNLEGIIPSEVLKKINLIKGDDHNFQKKLKKALGRRNYKKYAKIITNCARHKTKANLKKIFGKYYKNGKVEAFWFTGDLKIPKGKQIEYVHMGYMSTYEKELNLSIENGVLVGTVEYSNKEKRVPKGYGFLNAISYSFLVPRNLIGRKQANILSDTISVCDKENNYCINSFSFFNKGRKTFYERRDLVEKTIDSINFKLKGSYSFLPRKTEKLRWGTASWIDGYIGEKRVRIFTIANIRRQLIIYFRGEALSKSEFELKANNITQSVRLMEFGF